MSWKLTMLLHIFLMSYLRCYLFCVCVFCTDSAVKEDTSLFCVYLMYRQMYKQLLGGNNILKNNLHDSEEYYAGSYLIS